MEFPAWATARSDAGVSPIIIDVDAQEAYPAVLDEYRALYKDRTPDFIPAADREAVLEDLASDEPSAYWLEVVHQSIKLELQLAARTSALDIRVSDPGKEYAQSQRAPGRGTLKATKGLEARKHFQALRGFIPNFA